MRFYNCILGIHGCQIADSNAAMSKQTQTNLSLYTFAVQVQRHGLAVIFINLDVYMLSVLFACESDIDIYRS
jgi:hypothetical protein